MPDNYRDAAIRHYRDAQTLKDAGQLDNAGHLIGFSAECAIKENFKLSGGNSPAQHLPLLLAAARKHLSSRRDYTAMYNVLKTDIFSDWNVNHRYASNDNVTAEQFEAWNNVTRRVLAAAQIREAMKLQFISISLCMQ